MTLAVDFYDILETYGYPADLCILKYCDIPERLLTGDIEEHYYNAVLDSEIPVGGGRGQNVFLNKPYM